MELLRITDFSPALVAMPLLCLAAWCLYTLFLGRRFNIPAVKATWIETLLFGHALSALSWRSAGGVQGFLKECWDSVGSNIFWFRMGPLHANVVIGEAEASWRPLTESAPC